MALATREALRVLHFEQEVRARAGGDHVQVSAYPPELCMVAMRRLRAAESPGAPPVDRVVYDDPPLPDEEAKLLAATDPEVALARRNETPPAVSAGRADVLRRAAHAGGGYLDAAHLEPERRVDLGEGVRQGRKLPR